MYSRPMADEETKMADAGEAAGEIRSTRVVRLAALILFLVPVLSLHKSLVVAPLLALMSACLLFGRSRPPSRRALLLAAFRAHWPLPGLLGMFVAWCLAACFWSFDPPFSLQSLAMLAGTVSGGWIFAALFSALPAGQRDRPMRALAVGLFVAGAAMFGVGVAERVCHVAVGRLLLAMDADTTVIAVLVWPVLAWQHRAGRKAAAPVLFLLSVGGIFLAHDLAAKVALVAGAVSGLAALWRPRILFRAVAGLAVAGCLGAPLAASHLPPPSVSADWAWLPSSAHHRLTIWAFTASHIVERPIAGWGFDGARAIPGGKAQVPVVRLRGCPGTGAPLALPGQPSPVPADCVVWEELLPLHPHDAWLQIWLELGGVGAVLAALLLGRFAGRLGGGRAPRDGMAAAAAALVAGLVVSSVSFGIWQSWWLSCLWICIGLTAPLLAPSRRSALRKTGRSGSDSA